MKANSVSSAGISNAMRHSQMRMQVDLVNAQKELNTGKVADTGLALGSRTTQAITFSRDLERLQTIIDSNGLVSARLKSTQDSLNQLADKAQTLLASLTSATSGDLTSIITRDSGKATLQALSSILNTSVNGEYLFAGTNTDVKPMSDFTAPGSQAQTDFNNAFVARFTFPPSDPLAANITAADMTSFINNDLQALFYGSGWGSWSTATDEPIVSRIALNETTDTSVSANNDGVRKLAMAASAITQLMTSNLSADAKTALIDSSLSLVGQAISSLGQTRSHLGIVQQRVADANTRMDTQIDLFDRHILDLEGVDPYEAATRVNDLVSQIEKSFALTARIQQLSLLNFLS